LDHGNVFAFGIGSSVNRYLMEGLAHAGMGEPFIVLNQDQAAAKAQAFKTYIDSPVLTDIRVRFDGLNAYDVEPATIPDLFAQKPVVVFGKYKGAARGKIIITGQTSAGEYRQEVAVQGSETANPALKYLWARERIRLLADINKLEASDKRVKEVTQLGLDYNLLTDYTSFIAIDSLKRTDGKNRTTVNQPLPLPEGVSDLAVGGAAQSQAYSPAMICKRACEAPAPSGYATRGGEADELESAKAEEKKDKAGAKSPLSAELQLRVIKGSLTSAQVLQTLSALKPGWLQLAQSHGKAGVLLLNLHIDAQGKLIKIETVQDTLGLADLNTKIERETRQITFAQESIGMVIRVEIRMK
jgi:Ca-activated chloride channel family protein